MELTQEQYAKIEKYLPKPRGKIVINNLQFLNALLYVAENGCKVLCLDSTTVKVHPDACGAKKMENKQ